MSKGGSPPLENGCVCVDDFETALRIGGASNRNPLLAQIYTDHLAAAADELATNSAVAAPHVQNTRARCERLGKVQHRANESLQHVRGRRSRKSVVAVRSGCFHAAILARTGACLQELAAIRACHAL